MKNPWKITAIAATVFLGVAFVVFHFEWPLPGWACRILDGKFQKFALELRYEGAYFDLLGNVRLANIRGHYQGLLDFSARQVLLRIFPLRGPEVVVDSGELHTGFLRLPIPETIQFSGTIQKRSEGFFFRDVRLKANSLVMLVHGIYEQSRRVQRIPTGSSSANAFFEKAMAGLLTRLCADKTLWVAQVEISKDSSSLTMAGHEIVFNSYKIHSPVMSIKRPASRMSISADEVDFPQGKILDAVLSYSAAEGDLWRMAARGARVDGTNVGTISASAHLPLNLRSDPKKVKNLAASVDFGDGSILFIDKGSLMPLQARLWGNLPVSMLSSHGVELKTLIPGFFVATLKDKLIYFDFGGGSGDFYGLSFDKVRAVGNLSQQGVVLNHFDIASGDSHAMGSLKYDFFSHAAQYSLTGEIDPLLIPWFGTWWNDFFSPFGKIRPAVALTLDIHPGQPPEASGIATAEKQDFRGVKLDRSRVAYRAEGGDARIDFFSKKNNETLKGTLDFKKRFSATLTGHVYPRTLFIALAGEPPEVLKTMRFLSPPFIETQINGDNYRFSLKSSTPVDFNALHFEDLSVAAHGDKRITWVDSVEFGFAGGRGGANAQVSTGGVGYGSFWLRGARLGEWPLLGPLSQMLKSRWFAFATLRFHSVDGSLLFEPSEIKVPALNLWGDEHAAVASGSINTQTQRLDFTVRLRTFAGSKQTLNVFAPLMQPIASVLEAHLTGPIQKPQWNLQLTAPSL